MGGRRETYNNRNKEKAIIYPSEIHSYFYCPRVFFFEKHLKKKPSLMNRFRLFLGTLFHLSFRIRDVIKRYSYEIPLETDLGNVKIRGRPDAFKIDNELAYIIERKSSKSPYKGAWISDIMQATAYGIIITREKQLSQAKIEIRYPNDKRYFLMDSKLTSLVLKGIDDMILIKYYGILPYAKRGNRCKTCPYRDECFMLDEDMDDYKNDLFENGSWIEKLNLLVQEDHSNT
ncbi:MAG: CRISPR-associated protein Cas4 [Caldisphaera sp.]|jgi:CRISPR-associated exonuclease Cas4|nr:CRISPR-associated protein Cas4 [Caldisphaera sp.]PMP89849.1 MAG: CRISPR-associated protein Cas4 [Caldisphaera sp.]